MFKHSWTVFWNLALFLYFANVLHRWVQAWQSSLNQ